MAFTNSYDTTSPADTQLANLLGADLRNFRVDTQQRMASISGLDAAKPTFNLDAQPANWNGILFFATDTGQIYKFTNPTWTNVTANFIANRASLKVLSAAGISVTGTTSPVQVASIPIPGGSMGTTGGLRITTFGLFEYSFSHGNGQEFLQLGGTDMNLTVLNSPPPGGPSSAQMPVLVRRYFINNGAVNSQVGFVERIGAGGASGPPPFGGGPNFPAAIDTSTTKNLTVSYINGTTDFTSIFYGLIVEFF